MVVFIFGPFHFTKCGKASGFFIFEMNLKFWVIGRRREKYSFEKEGEFLGVN